MSKIVINAATGEATVRELSAKDIADAAVFAAEHAEQQAKRKKILPPESIEKLLKKAGVSQADIDAEKV